MRKGLIVAAGLVATFVAAAAAHPGRPSVLVRTAAWADEFSGPAGAAPSRANWTYDLGAGINGWGNDELQTYTARRANAALDGQGHLLITARRERWVGPDGVSREYTSSRLITKHRVSFRYGRIAARIMLPAGQGLWPAFWLLGSNIDSVGWPNCGEIDVMEANGSEPREASGFVHLPSGGNDVGFGDTWTSRRVLTTGFHVYGVEWTADAVSFSVDGHRYDTIRRNDVGDAQWVLDQPMYIILNLAVGGGTLQPPSASTRFPARMLVDWVRVTP